MKEIPPYLMCFSHLRWDFVYQRPQHLLSRFANDCIVYFLEEPLFTDEPESTIQFSRKLPNLWVGVPLISNSAGTDVDAVLTQLLDKFFATKKVEDFAFWYYTPMALNFTSKYNPKITIYDCMDELSAFKNAPAKLKDLEKQLMNKADVVFTGGQALYEAKKNQHANIFPFPSSIEKEHFAIARTGTLEPEDQANIKGVKLGFYGVIDERFDIDLIRNIADARPDWQLILIGPVVKISPDILPRNKNIHYLGQKNYKELPAYLSGWDIALIPFLLNESTRFISPTKTPEYMSAGRPVISTPIRDVVHPYGINKLVHIGSSAEDFIKHAEKELAETDKSAWLAKSDAFLADNCWDNTYATMTARISNTVKNKGKISLAS
ncbi:MAG: glycosyltransferase family 1 protein [Arcticibacter sp.]